MKVVLTFDDIIDIIILGLGGILFALIGLAVILSKIQAKIQDRKKKKDNKI